MAVNAQYLRLLAIFHYVVGGFAGLFGCVFFIHLAVGIAMVEGAFDQEKTPPPPWAGWIFVGVGTLVIVSAWTFALCVLLAGRWLAAADISGTASSWPASNALFRHLVRCWGFSPSLFWFGLR